MTPPAVPAIAAVDGRVKGDPIARAKVRDAASDCRDRPGSFVTHDDLRNPPAGASGVTVNVRSTNADSGDLNQQIELSRIGGCGKVHHLQRPVLDQLQSLHACSLPF